MPSFVYLKTKIVLLYTHPEFTQFPDKSMDTHTSSNWRDTEPKIDGGYDTASDP